MGTRPFSFKLPRPLDTELGDVELNPSEIFRWGWDLFTSLSHLEQVQFIVAEVHPLLAEPRVERSISVTSRQQEAIFQWRDALGSQTAFTTACFVLGLRAYKKTLVVPSRAAYPRADFHRKLAEWILQYKPDENLEDLVARLDNASNPAAYALRLTHHLRKGGPAA
jgi:hypothetical protein